MGTSPALLPNNLNSIAHQFRNEPDLCPRECVPGIKDHWGTICAGWEVTSVLQNVTCFVGPTFHLFDKSSSFFIACLPTDFQPVSEDGSGGHRESTWPLMVLTQLSTAALATVQTCRKEKRLISKWWRGIDQCVCVRVCVLVCRRGLEEGRKPIYKSHLANPSILSWL